MDWEELILKTIMGITAIFVVILIVGMIWVIYDSVTAETFSLRKDEWVCAKSHTENVTTLMPVGKVMVPMTNTDAVCDQWIRR